MGGRGRWRWWGCASPCSVLVSFCIVWLCLVRVRESRMNGVVVGRGTYFVAMSGSAFFAAQTDQMLSCRVWTKRWMMTRARGVDLDGLYGYRNSFQCSVDALSSSWQYTGARLRLLVVVLLLLSTGMHQPPVEVAHINNPALMIHRFSSDQDPTRLPHPNQGEAAHAPSIALNAQGFRFFTVHRLPSDPSTTLP